MPNKFKTTFQICTLLFPALLATTPFCVAQVHQPLTLVATTPLPEISGDFDHFAVDLKRGRLISAAEEHHTLEIFDLKTGKHLQSIAGFKAPHSIAYVPEKDEFFITDGEDSSCIILAGADFIRLIACRSLLDQIRLSMIRRASVFISATAAATRSKRLRPSRSSL